MAAENGDVAMDRQRMVCLAGALTLVACASTRPAPQPAAAPPAVQSAPGRPAAPAEAKARPAPALTLQGILEMLPQSRAGVAILDWKRVYALVASVEAAMQRIDAGARAMTYLRQATASVPFPWTEGGLRVLGLDTGKPLVVAAYGGGSYVALLPLHDVVTFEAQMARLGGTTWHEAPRAGLRLRGLAGVLCKLSADRALCSNDGDLLVKILAHKPTTSSWALLRAEERVAAGRASLLAWSVEPAATVVGTARVEDDGLSSEVRVRGWVIRTGGIALAAGPSLLRGFVADSHAALHVRLNLRGLSGLLPGPLPDIAPGLSSAKLLSSATGEVLLIERRSQDAAIIVGLRDTQLAQSMVDELGTRLLAQGKKLAKERDMPTISVRREMLGTRTGYRVRITTKKKPLPIDATLGVAAGPLGLVLGSWSAVKELARLDRAPTPTVTPSSAEEKLALGEESRVTLRTFLGDPLGPLASKLTQLLAAAGASIPPAVISGIELGRFLLDHLHQATLAVVPGGADELRIVGRVSTLHRGQTDDGARALWLKGMKAKYGGDSAAYGKVLGELAASDPQTRYATLRARKGSVASTAMMGILAAIAIPAFVKYTRKAKTVEATEGLDKLTVGAKSFFQADHYDQNGLLEPKRFPRGKTGWAPKKPCCKQPHGRCQVTAKEWQASPWRELHFALSDPHYYQFRYASAGENKIATFTIEARADLDCNGVYSSYKMFGSVDDEYGVVVKGPVIQNELE
jgi:hypothetical protein